MQGKLLRLGIVIATLILGIFLVSSLYRNFSHLMEQPQSQGPSQLQNQGQNQDQAEQPAASSAPAQQPS